MNINEGSDDEVVVDDSKVVPISLNFGEVMLIEGSLKNYEEELVDDVVAALPINRPAFFVKDILLKIGSAYVDLFDHRVDLDFYMDVNFTEKELWVLRQVVQPAMSFNNISMGPLLKKKIFEALITLNTPEPLVTEGVIEEPSKYDRADALLEWRRTQQDN